MNGNCGPQTWIGTSVSKPMPGRSRRAELAPLLFLGGAIDRRRIAEQPSKLGSTRSAAPENSIWGVHVERSLLRCSFWAVQLTGGGSKSSRASSALREERRSRENSIWGVHVER